MTYDGRRLVVRGLRHARYRCARALALAFATIGIGGCLADPQLQADVAGEAEPLARWSEGASGFECTSTPMGGLAYWAPGAVVELCFTGPGNGAAFRSEITSALTATWGSAANLTFHNNGTCPASISATWVSVYLQNNASDNAGQGAPGRGSRLISSCAPRDYLWAQRSDIQVGIFGGQGTDQAKQTAVHEFGHVLGFYHEHERQDSTAAGCTDLDTTTGWLTVYDARSIMSDCAAEAGRVAGDYSLTSASKM